MDKSDFVVFLSMSVIVLGACALSFYVGVSFQANEMMQAPRTVFFLEKSVQCADFSYANATYIKPVGMSMLPTFRPGSILYAKPYNPRLPLVEGDIVSVNTTTNNYVHRVSAVYNNYVLTKGDANQGEDHERVNLSDIESVVCATRW